MHVTGAVLCHAIQTFPLGRTLWGTIGGQCDTRTAVSRSTGLFAFLSALSANFHTHSFVTAIDSALKCHTWSTSAFSQFSLCLSFHSHIFLFVSSASTLSFFTLPLVFPLYSSLFSFVALSLTFLTILLSIRLFISVCSLSCAEWPKVMVSFVLWIYRVAHEMSYHWLCT